MKAVLRYLGAKNALAPWIVSFFPPHRCYVEPFGGSGAVLFNKPPAEIEVYNDKYGRLVNFFRVLRDHGEELCRLIELTPYAQDEYRDSFEISEDPIEDARKFAVFSMMSYGMGINKPGFRRGGLLRNTPCPQSWRDYPETLRECAVALRNRNIEINNTDALAIMRSYDSQETLHYVDPPYPQDLRVSKYHEEYDEHERLLDFILSLKGKVVVSSYMSELYASKLSSWHMESKAAKTTGGVVKQEVIWMNYQPQMMLF